MPSLWLNNSRQKAETVFFGNLVHLHVLQYFFAVAKEFLVVGTRDVFPVLLTLLVFLNITQFLVLNPFCIINLHFLADNTFIVVCFFVADFSRF